MGRDSRQDIAKINRRQIAALMADGRPRTADDVAHALRIHVQSARGALRTLVGFSLIQREKVQECTIYQSAVQPAPVAAVDPAREAAA